MTTLDTLLTLARGTLESQVGKGRIQGGWEYVWVSYGIAWGGLLAYSLWLWRRQSKFTKEDTK